jgi:hypothetical protein
MKIKVSEDWKLVRIHPDVHAVLLLRARSGDRTITKELDRILQAFFKEELENGK